MGEFHKARLLRLDAKATPDAVEPGFEVQFNPQTLRIQYTNSIDEGGQGRARQRQQALGSATTTLSLDLHFDTAEESTTESPLDVRRRTQEVARFILPGKDKNEAPPRVLFAWGTFTFDGLVTGLTEDLELFSLEGVPLRAKLSVSIKKQDPKFEALESGAGAKTAAGKTKPGGSTAGPGTQAAGPARPGTQAAGPARRGTQAAGPARRTATALGGESAADFAVRNGLDPAAWRAVALASGANPLSLPAGAQIDFNADASAAGGLSAAATGMGTGAGVEASLGLSIATGTGVSGADATAAAGFALAAAGGVSAATQAAQVVGAAVAAAEARGAFGAGVPPQASGIALGALPLPTATAAAGAPPAGAQAALPDQPRPPLAQRGFAAPGTVSAPAPRPPQADPRAVSFGLGVPLRPRLGGPAQDRPGAPVWVTVGRRPRGIAAPQTRDPHAAPWVQLPVAAPDRQTAAATQRRARRTTTCGRCRQLRPCACGDAR